VGEGCCQPIVVSEKPTARAFRERSRELQLSPAFHGLQDGNFVGVFQVAAHGQASGDAGDPSGAQFFDLLGEINRGGLALDRRIGGEDNLFDVPVFQPPQKTGDAQMLGANAVQRRKRAMQDVVDAVEVSGFFDSCDAGGLFNHAHLMLVSGGALAIDTRIRVGDVVADGAEVKALLYVTDGGGQCFGVFVTGAQNVEGEALRRLASNAGKLFELVNQTNHRFGKFGHNQYEVLRTEYTD